MEKPLSHYTNSATALIWQGYPEDGGQEPALSLQAWTGGRTIELRQGADCIMLNYETVDELCRVLKHLAKQ